MSNGTGPEPSCTLSEPCEVLQGRAGLSPLGAPGWARGAAAWAQQGSGLIWLGLGLGHRTELGVPEPWKWSLSPVFWGLGKRPSVLLLRPENRDPVLCAGVPKQDGDANEPKQQ